MRFRELREVMDGNVSFVLESGTHQMLLNKPLYVKHTGLSKYDEARVLDVRIEFYNSDDGGSEPVLNVWIDEVKQ